MKTHEYGRQSLYQGEERDEEYTYENYSPDLNNPDVEDETESEIDDSSFFVCSTPFFV